jgi:hypothetical protein
MVSTWFGVHDILNEALDQEQNGQKAERQQPSVEIFRPTDPTFLNGTA